MTKFCKNINPRKEVPELSNFAIMRWAKNKFGGIASAEYHQRTELHKNCEHPELREYNITVKKCEDETLRKSIKKMLIEQQERTGRRVRKDATVMVDFVMTFSPEMIGKVNMDELDKWGTEKLTGACIFTDGTYIYFSDAWDHYILNGDTWEQQNWIEGPLGNGLVYFSGNYVWTDGTNVYYSFYNSAENYIFS